MGCVDRANSTLGFFSKLWSYERGCDLVAQCAYEGTTAGNDVDASQRRSSADLYDACRARQESRRLQEVVERLKEENASLQRQTEQLMKAARQPYVSIHEV